jgi:hypothetical protein
MDITWAEPRPNAGIPGRPNPHDEFWDIVPIAYYPDDLPELETDPFGWTPAELEDAAREARRLLFDEGPQCT